MIAATVLESWSRRKDAEARAERIAGSMRRRGLSVYARRTASAGRTEWEVVAVPVRPQGAEGAEP